MTESPLMVINQANADITRFIILGSWDVNEEDVYETWEDANRLAHRGVVRQKVKGSFDVKFYSIQDHEYFIDLLTNPLSFNNDSSGTINCTVYINNKNKTKTIDAFIDFKLKNYVPAISEDRDPGFTVSLEER